MKGNKKKRVQRAMKGFSKISFADDSKVGNAVPCVKCGATACFCIHLPTASSAGTSVEVARLEAPDAATLKRKSSETGPPADSDSIPKKKKKKSKHKKNKQATTQLGDDQGDPVASTGGGTDHDELTRAAKTERKKRKKSKTQAAATAKSAVDGSIAPPPKCYPFPVDDADHAESPPQAYSDIAPVLGALAESLSKSPAELRIYDPYFCAGRVE
jgi:hypothetical protein